MEIKYGVQRHDNLFLQMLYFDNYVVYNINSDDVYKIVTPRFVKIENITKGWANMRRIIQATYHLFLNWLHLVMCTYWY